MVTKWLHLEMVEGDPWVLPIWTAVHNATREGRTTLPGPEVGELALHVSTRLTMLPRIVRRINQGCTTLYRTVRARQSVYESTATQDGYAFPVDNQLKYELLLDIDSLLFEVNSACELIRKFFATLHEHAGRPIPTDAIGKTLREVLTNAGQDPAWFVQLDNHRNFFMHEGTPYVAVDLSRADEDRYDLLIMKETLRHFTDPQKFLRLSDLDSFVRGFAVSKVALQQHLIHLFEK